MTTNLASFQLRLLAWITDMVIGLFLFMAFFLIAASQADIAHVVAVIFIYLAIVGLNPLYYYQSVILTHYFGGSVGKLLTGLRVTNESGTRLPFKRVFFRQTIGYMFASLILGLGFWSIIKDTKKQGWHDKAVGSLVVIQKPLWYVGVLVSVIYLVISCYFGITAFHKITNGPLGAQIQTITTNLSEPSR
jgi:uncharacterized RDD family membrane protein YckC